MAMTKLKIGKTVLIILVLNIILPTADVFTDLRLIEKLYRGVPVCVWTDGISRDYDEYSKCNKVGADQYCVGEKVSTELCGVRTNSDSKYKCRYYRHWSSEYKDYKQCKKVGYDTYCSDPATNKTVCDGSHPKMATAMLIPFCLNYIFCFITFFRQGTDKKKTFIFPLLNLYPQFEAAKLILAILRDPETGIQMKLLYEQNIGLFETFIESVPTTLILTYIWISAVGDAYMNKSLRTIIIGEELWNGGLLHVSYQLFILTFILSCFSACLGLAKCLKNGVARPIAPGGPVDGLLSGRFILAFIASACCLVVRGVCIGTFNMKNWNSSTKLLLILLMFLPQLLLAIFSTLDLSSRNSLKILISHPSLILLSVFTFFTFSKIQCCGDRRVKFSVRFTLINMAVSVIAQAVMFYAGIFIIEFLTIIGPLTLLGIFCTLSFLYLDKLFCCCCSCFLSAPGQLSVFDPDHPQKNSMIKNGDVEEVIEVEADATGEENIWKVENEIPEECISLETIDDIVEIETTVNDLIDDDIIATVVNDSTEGRDTETTRSVIDIPGL